MKSKHAKGTQSRLVSELMQNKTLFFIAFIGTIIQVFLTVYLPVLIGQVIDAVVNVNSDETLYGILIMMLVVIALNTIIQWINPMIYNRLTLDYCMNLRQRAMSNIHHIAISYLDKKSIGDLVSRVTTDTDQLNNGLLLVFNQFFVGILTIIFTIISMARIDILMLLLVLVLTPLSLFFARFIAQKSYHLFQEQTKSRGQQSQYVEEMVRQAELVQSFNAQNQVNSAFNKINETYANVSQSAIFYSSTINPSTRFINSVIYALIAGVGALRIFSNAFSIGQLVTFLNYVNQYTKPFNDISSVLSELQSALACAERLYTIIDEPEDFDRKEKIILKKTIKGEITFENVYFGYEKNKPLLKNINFSIPAGSRVAIVGPTGAGKSTLINLLMQFYAIDSGDIKLDGYSIYDFNKEEYRHYFGMVLQETWLKSTTIAQNIAYAFPKASQAAIEEAAKLANADFFIKQLPKQYQTQVEDNRRDLSQGQKQLLAISRVFLKKPKILILDEATLSIDTRTEKLVQGAFDTLMEKRTSFIIAHRLSTIQEADLILVMNKGSIIEQGTHDSLMSSKGFYYNMQMSQYQ
ncbi:hypothetical protein HMPREF9318_00356 [Streptococcus urinalis FB127-CNA-2]|uniref:ABC transporter transmembrane region n=1 Tax=Streptococcus urinalis 2285-97 TaxID=764291 RepID=G5KFU7_9STRE|nr:ABC transporter ATP-binding protein [Streptococcus urinalis]EHJ57639.1 ABC transporter transmembrane region [Streptococcus urinalis 2285-97]EKS22158.1 hypothetical protein HMPREF9318_00356 [Streptococcus urinalis FB127-CNA-2]VEF31970.1 ABC transporter, ATP-binding/permease protein [Streptococcus urinalis]